MEDTFLNESELRAALGQRRPAFPDVQFDRPVTLQEVDTEFRTARKSRGDLGITNHVLYLFLEPRNPFEPQATRKPRMEAVIFGTLVALVVSAIAAFNLAAPRPF